MTISMAEAEAVSASCVRSYLDSQLVGAAVDHDVAVLERSKLCVSSAEWYQEFRNAMAQHATKQWSALHVYEDTYGLYEANGGLNVINLTTNEVWGVASSSTVSCARLVEFDGILAVWVGDKEGNIHYFVMDIIGQEGFQLQGSIALSDRAGVLSLLPSPWSYPSTIFFCWVTTQSAISLLGFDANNGMRSLLSFTFPRAHSCSGVVRTEVSQLLVLSQLSLIAVSYSYCAACRYILWLFDFVYSPLFYCGPVLSDCRH